MLDALNSACLYVMDFVLGWSLALPRDLVLFLVALLTGLLLTVVRTFTTDQDMLKRFKNDKARLKQLIREARAKGDKEAVGRHKTTLQQIGLRSFKFEGKPLLASAIPIALLAMWAFSRMGYYPAAPGKPVSVRVKFQPREVGKVAYLIPAPGMEVTNGVYQRIYQPHPQDANADKDPTGAQENKPPQDPNALAEWTLCCRKQAKPYPLVFHQGGKTLRHELLVDGRRYSVPEGAFPEDPSAMIEVALAEYRPFGIVPGIGWLAFPPWIVGYLLIVLPLALVLKPILRIC